MVKEILGKERTQVIIKKFTLFYEERLFMTSTESFHRIRNLGTVYIPTQFMNIVEDSALKLFSGGELNKQSQIFDHIRRGGVAVLSGRWDKILELSEYADKKKEELSKIYDIPKREKGQKDNQRGKQSRKKSQIGLLRLMVTAKEEVQSVHQWSCLIGKLDVEPHFQIPYLLELVGDVEGANKGFPFLIPVLTLRNLQESLKQSHFISALDGSVVAPLNVLPPNSQETINLISEELKSLKEKLPSELDCRESLDCHESLDILDMGCGSGCLTLLAAQVFGEQNIKIVASDILPEAIAATKINVQQFIEEKRIPPNLIEITNGGNLFEPINERRFYLIIFNAPWVIAPATARDQIATNDENQNIVRSFLFQAKDYLKDDGHILLAYADNSGQKFIEKLEKFIQEGGFQIATILKERIHTRRTKRKWETVLVYILTI